MLFKSNDWICMQIYWVLAETVSHITVSLVRVTNSEVQTRWPRWFFFRRSLCCGFTCIFSSHKASTGSLVSDNMSKYYQMGPRQTEWVFSQCAPKCALTSPSSRESVANLPLRNVDTGWAWENEGDKEREWLPCIFQIPEQNMCFPYFKDELVFLNWMMAWNW